MIFLLHSTQLPENLGAVARVMANFNLLELRLITPHVSPLDAKAIATSAGAEEILKTAQIYGSLSDASADLNTMIGTCGDIRTGIRYYETPESFFSTSQDYGKIGILFGPERTGLSQEDLALCQATLRIPVNPDFSSMNLSHAVAVVAYEYFKYQQKLKSFLETGLTSLATQVEKEAFFTTLEAILDEVGYWRVDSKKPLMKQNLQNFFFRSSLTKQEIQTLIGMIQTIRNPRKTG